MDINISEVTVLQLKNWLELLHLSTKGTKAELFARLSSVPAEIRGKVPKNTGEEREAESQAELENDGESRSELVGAVETLENLRAEIAKAQDMLENLKGQINSAGVDRNSGGRDDENEQNADQRSNGGKGNENVEQQNEGGAENENGQRRNGGGRGIEEAEQRNGGDRGDDNRRQRIDGGRDGGDRDGGRDDGDRDRDRDGGRDGGDRDGDRDGGRGLGNAAYDEIAPKQDNEMGNGGFSSPGFNMAKEMLMDFTDKVSVRSWIAQWGNISALFSLSDMQRRVLLISKLKGRARQWLADGERFTKPTNELLEELQLAFGSVESKSTLRRKFEARVWSPTEEFAIYFEEKCRLARDVSMESDELLDGLVEGIPALSLRTQAKLQCFDGPERMLRAFADIRLPTRATTTIQRTTSKVDSGSSETRCFNCNAKGHWKRECTKPTRPPGSCYGCGAEDHRVAECPQNKKKAENKYSAK